MAVICAVGAGAVRRRRSAGGAEVAFFLQPATATKATSRTAEAKIEFVDSMMLLSHLLAINHFNA